MGGFFFQAEDGIRDRLVTGVQTCALPILVKTEVLDMVEETIDHEKCLMQNAEIVEMIVKYHSNQKKTDLFIAMNASKNIETISKLF